MYSSFCIFVKDPHEKYMVHLKGFILNELAEIVSKMNKKKSCEVKKSELLQVWGKT